MKLLKNSLSVVLMLFCIQLSFAAQKPKVTKLVCEYHTNPIGIDVEKPRFSWQILSEVTNTKQNAYEIRVASSIAKLKSVKSLIWSSGKVLSDKSVNIVYGGPKLKSME